MTDSESLSVDAPVAWLEHRSEPWSAIPRMTLPEFLVPRLRRGGSRPLVVFDDGQELSCDELLAATERFTAYLRTRLEPGDRVALAVDNRSEYLIAYFAVIAARGIVVALGPTIGPDDAGHVLRASGAKLAIALPAAAEVIAAVGAEVPGFDEALAVEGAEPEGLSRFYRDLEPAPLEDPEARLEELTDIGFTSGTTGMPKALAGDHTELLHYADSYLRHAGLGPDDRILCPLQFHYGDPLYMLLATLEADTTIVVMRKFSVSRFWNVARDYGATRISTIGSIPNLLLTAPPSAAEREHTVEMASAVAVPASQHQELIDRFGFPWFEGYGSSESGPAIAMPRHLADRYVGSGAIGLAYPEVETRLVDAEGQVVEGPGNGELQLRGHILFRGYLDNEEATAEVLDGDWLRTGDLLERDADGIFYFRGRRKELIRRGGENIAPAEVEAALRKHPAVIDTAVVPVEDAIRGEEVKAYVELKEPVDPAGLVEFCAERLAPFKVPRYVEIRTDPFPRTPSQRIPKNQLKVDGAHRTDTAWDREAQVEA